MDERLRKATRSTTDPESRARLLAEARRAGRVSDERLRAAAWAGDEGAGLLMPDEHDAGKRADLSASLTVLQEQLDVETHAVALLGLDAWVQAQPGGRRGAHVGHMETVGPALERWFRTRTAEDWETLEAVRMDCDMDDLGHLLVNTMVFCGMQRGHPATLDAVKAAVLAWALPPDLRVGFSRVAGSYMFESLTSLGLEPTRPMPEAELQAVEAVLGPLPACFRLFLATYGPLDLDGTICTRQPRFGTAIAISEFLGTAGQLLEALHDVGEALPPGVLPFAQDGADNWWCIGVSDRQPDAVYFHDHSLGWRSDADRLIADGQPVPEDLPYQTVELVAPTFEAFVAGLRRHEG